MTTQYLVPLRDAERELVRQMKSLQGAGQAPMQRARMSNLVILCGSLEQSIGDMEQVAAITAVHPSRTILLVGEPDTARELTARVLVRPISASNKQLCVEMVTLHAGGAEIARLPFAVRSLLIGDLPVNLWWQTPVPPPLAGALMYDLCEPAQQVIYDSVGWPDPARGVAATAAWLEQVERPSGRWRVASDLNWRRLKYWRRLLTQSLDEASAPGAVEAVSEIVVEHGPHAVVQGWLLVSWLSRRLGWRVRTGRVTPGVEMSWQFATPTGEARVGVRRLEDGPADVRRVVIRTKLDGKAVTVIVAPDGPQRLSMAIEGGEGAPRTVTVPPLSSVDLIGRQLSDRERDPAFRDSMAVAQVMAQSMAR